MTAGQRLKPRQLHIAWIDAGERRLITRALWDAGFSPGRIARWLQVSRSTIYKDLRP